MQKNNKLAENFVELVETEKTTGRKEISVDQKKLPPAFFDYFQLIDKASNE